MSERLQAVVFALDAQRFALPLAAVRRIVRAVELTPLPGAPDIVLGAIDLAGRVVPVLDMRKRFGLPEREVDPSDHFLIAATPRREMALVIDEARGVVECERSAVMAASRISPGLEWIDGVLRLDDGLVLIHDLDTFLSLDEARSLDETVDQGA